MLFSILNFFNVIIPFVSVPVLSNNTHSTMDAFSKTCPPLIKIPFSVQFQHVGTAKVNEQRQATTKADSAIRMREIFSENQIIHEINVIRLNAKIPGIKYRAIKSACSCVDIFRHCEYLGNKIIRTINNSLAVDLIIIGEFKLNAPARTLSPIFIKSIT